MTPADEAKRTMAEYCGEERRAAHETWINKIEEHVERLLLRMTLAENFRGQMKMASVIVPLVLSVVWLGGFIYTYNHKQEAAAVMSEHKAEADSHFKSLKSDATREADKFHRALNEQARTIGRLEGKVLVIEDRYVRLLSDIEKLNSNLEKFAHEARRQNQIQRVEIENYKTKNGEDKSERYKIPQGTWPTER